MRRPSKDSSHKLSAESQRLVSISQAIVQAASRIEERALERQLDTQLQKLLKTGHQDTVDTTLNVLFKEDLNAYDTLMEGVEAVSESSVMIDQHEGVETTYQALLVAAPILAWTRFSIASGTIPADILSTLSAHFGAHLLADGVRMSMAPTLFAIDQLPRTHAETYAATHKLAQAAYKGTAIGLIAVLYGALQVTTASALGPALGTAGEQALPLAATAIFGTWAGRLVAVAAATAMLSILVADAVCTPRERTLADGVRWRAQ